MTLPSERRRAVSQAREFMRSLLSASETPRVPRRVRELAYCALRHYPSDHHLLGEHFLRPDLPQGEDEDSDDEDESPESWPSL